MAHWTGDACACSGLCPHGFAVGIRSFWLYPLFWNWLGDKLICRCSRVTCPILRLSSWCSFIGAIVSFCFGLLDAMHVATLRMGVCRWYWLCSPSSGTPWQTLVAMGCSLVLFWALRGKTCLAASWLRIPVVKLEFVDMLQLRRCLAVCGLIGIFGVLDGDWPFDSLIPFLAFLHFGTLQLAALGTCRRAH